MILYWRLIPQCLAGTPRRLRSYFHPCRIYWRSRRGGGCSFLYSWSVWPWGGSWPVVFWVVPCPHVSFWYRGPVLALVWKYHQSLCSLKCPKTKHKWPIINEFVVIWVRKVTAIWIVETIVYKFTYPWNKIFENLSHQILMKP